MFLHVPAEDEDVVMDGDAVMDLWWKIPVLLMGPKNSLFFLCVCSPVWDWKTQWEVMWRGT